MAKPRKSEVTAIALLLDGPAESAEELAGRVIEKLDELRRERDTYAVLTAIPGYTWGYGSYSTPGQAVKAMGAGVGRGLDNSRVGVIKISSPKRVEEILSETGKTGCSDCQHPRETHNFPKSSLHGCVITGCLCRGDGK